MKFAVSHVTRYAYARPVDLGAHLVHLKPRSLPWQRVISAALVPDPPPQKITGGRDCFGNEVSWVFLEKPHPKFSITMDAVVEVTAPFVPPAEATPAWEDVSSAAFAGGAKSFQAAEFLFESPRVPAVPEAADYVSSSFTPRRPILECLLDLNLRINREFAFRAGVTTVNSTVRQVLAQRAGVCQDFSHLMIAGLRGMGLPARYTSGYIRTHPPPGQTRPQGGGPVPCLGRRLAGAGTWLGRSGPHERHRHQGRTCRAWLGARLWRREPDQRSHPGRRQAHRFGGGGPGSLVLRKPRGQEVGPWTPPNGAPPDRLRC